MWCFWVTPKCYANKVEPVKFKCKMNDCFVVPLKRRVGVLMLLWRNSMDLRIHSFYASSHWCFSLFGWSRSMSNGVLCSNKSLKHNSWRLINCLDFGGQGGSGVTYLRLFSAIVIPFYCPRRKMSVWTLIIRLLCELLCSWSGTLGLTEYTRQMTLKGTRLSFYVMRRGDIFDHLAVFTILCGRLRIITFSL